MQHNTFNQPIGDALPDFTVGKMPDVQCLNGRFCRLERLSVAKHAEDLWLVYNHETRPQNWTYLPPSFGPFAEKSAFIAFLTQTEAAQDPYCFSIIDLATEAQFLLAQYVFETLQYRRYEWKCDALNQPSRNAAERLGFTFEGIFRQAQVYHQRNRDTAWFSMLDSEWSARKQRFQAWLADENFNVDGSQKIALREIK